MSAVIDEAVKEAAAGLPFVEHLPLIAGAPGGIKKLRELILHLAIRGRLTRSSDELLTEPDGHELVAQLKVERERLLADGLLGRERRVEPVSPDDAPFKARATWGWARLGESVQLINGKAFKPSEWSTQGVPIIRIQNLNNAKAPFNYCDGAVEERYRVHSGDLLLSWSGTPGTSFGAFVWQRGFAYLNQHIFLVRIIGAFERDFLHLAINEKLADMIANARGAVGLKHVTKAELDRLVIAVPPKSEQIQIVERYKELMALCDRLEAQQADAEAAHATLVKTLLDTLTQSQSAADFTANWQRLSAHLDTLFTTEDSINALKQALLHLAVAGKLIELRDEDVQVGKLSDFVDFLNGYAFKSEWFASSGVRLLRNANLGVGRCNWDSPVFLPESRAAEFERFRLQEGDLVLALDRPLINAGLKVARLSSEDVPSLLLQRVAKVTPRADKVDPEFLYAWMNSPAFASAIDPGRSNGIPHISTRQVGDIEFRCLPLASQCQSVSVLRRLLALVERLQDKLRRFARAQEQLSSAIVESIAI